MTRPIPEHSSRPRKGAGSRPPRGSKRTHRFLTERWLLHTLPLLVRALRHPLVRALRHRLRVDSRLVPWRSSGPPRLRRLFRLLARPRPADARPCRLHETRRPRGRRGLRHRPIQRTRCQPRPLSTAREPDAGLPPRTDEAPPNDDAPVPLPVSPSPSVGWRGSGLGAAMALLGLSATVGAWFWQRQAQSPRTPPHTAAAMPPTRAAGTSGPVATGATPPPTQAESAAAFGTAKRT